MNLPEKSADAEMVVIASGIKRRSLVTDDQNKLLLESNISDLVLIHDFI